jgi:NDP-sugar pyrophosphorylase family protein
VDTRPEVVILVGGFGNRFRKDSQSPEKPLIPVFGFPQIVWAIRGAIRSYPYANFYIAVRNGLIDQIRETLDTYFPGLVREFVDIGISTRGPAQSLRIFIEDSKSLNRLAPLVVCDNDCLNYLNMPDNPNFVSVTTSENPGHCFVVLDSHGKLTELREKEIVGNLALAGNYGFESSEMFIDRYKDTKFIKNEEFLSDVVSQSLLNGIEVSPVRCINYFSLGTPKEIELISEELLSFK